MNHVSCGLWSLKPDVGRWPLLAMIVVAALLTLPAHAQSLFMKATCDGQLLTAGESNSAISALADYVEISSIHHDLSVPLDTGGSTPIVGQASVDALRVAKSASTSSIGMIAAMVRGRNCEQILLENWVIASEFRRIWQLDLQDAYITERKEWHTSGGNMPQESFELYPARLRWTYYPYDNAGVALPPIDFGWDFLTNSPQ